MKKVKTWRKLTLPALITLSLSMLGVFQIFWLSKIFDEQRIYLHREVDNIFRTTAFGLQDSIIQCRILHNNGSWVIDSLPDMSSNRRVKADKLVMVLSDSSLLHQQRIQIKRTKTPTENLANNHLNLDSISVDTLEHYFRLALHQANIHLPFVIVKLPDSLRKNFGRDIWHQYPGVSTKPVFTALTKMQPYFANFPKVQAYIWQKSLPYVAFSIVFCGITVFAFFMVYNNLRQQEKLMVLKNDFISNVTHELKTPITTVGVAIEALSNFNVLQNPDQTREYLSISKNELNRLSILVDKVLKMAIFEQHEPALNLETIDLKQLVEQVLASLKLQFDKYRADVFFEAKGGFFEVKADRIHLTNVVYNLIDNALKYGGAKPKIIVQLGQEAHEVVLSVADSGEGIPPQYQTKIFEKFFRVPKGDVHNAKGHGLGLSYVAQVLQKHGGHIRLNSVPQQGSTFYVAMPLAYLK